MPGTHYDNDHSFIEELPFHLKKIAHRIIRDDSLETMILSVDSQASTHFKDMDKVSVDDILKTLHACLVAKITFFDKQLYVLDNEMAFLYEQLYRSLRYLLTDRLNAEASDDELLDFLKQYYPKTHYWIHKTDTADRYSLAIRSRRENTRRFYRYTANMTYHFVRLGAHENATELQGDIYTSGIKHFTKIVNQKLDTLMDHYQKNIREALVDSHPEAYDLFTVVAEKNEYLREVLNGISVGRLSVEESKRFLKANLESTLDFASLKGNIRTESILRDFEEKVDHIGQSTLTLLENSTPHKLYEGPVLEKVKIDYDIRDYVEKKKRNSSSLLMSFINLYHYAALLEKIYNNISSSNYIIVFPEYWSADYHDISSGGFSFFTPFLVDINDHLELFFRFDLSASDKTNDYEIVHQKAKVVRIDEKTDIGAYQISCQFLHPDKNTMDLIRKATQSKELKDAFSNAELIDTVDEYNQ
ncbi:PilZ domain-containing protein [Thiomicrospira sp. S5]|uniref:PilZ domain-containing protein n=1 Tax=Thiomicrospira sp. S5 TaxID=1803865 RepID=UPI000F8A106D|nr:PilZ domain-containing protein [Thiomicrospira sp. S5]AZR82196.1 hypothetical protein AYJ59_07820 [Thiomicrospira sp. S5]